MCILLQGRGTILHEYVNVCISSAANALGINVTIFQRTVNSVMKINQTCEKFKLKVNVHLIFHNRQKCKKNNDCHYNPILHRQYYKKNELAVKSRMVVIRQNDESDGQQIWNDLELAQQLSHEASHCGLDSQGSKMKAKLRKVKGIFILLFFSQCNIQKDNKLS